MLAPMTTAPALSTASYQPRWELGTALAYGGALVALVADNWGLYRLGQHHRWAGAFLAVGLFLALLIAARVLTRRGEALAGGLSALLAATALPWFVAAVEQLHSHLHAGGAAAELSPGFLLLSQPHGTSAGWIGADVVALLASLILLARYRFALLAVPAVFAIWFVGQDIAAHGSDRAQGLGAFASGMSPGRSAAAAFVVAAVLIGIGLLFERWGWRREAFWPHLGAGLSVVQALIGLGTTYDPDVVLGVGLGLGAVGLLLAIGIARSSYGVIGGGLVLLATAYFAEKAAHASGLGFPFVVALLALCLAAGGVLLARRAR
jgi:hypothetical protein